MNKPILFALVGLIVLSCSPTKKEFPDPDPIPPLKLGEWRLVFDLGEEELPINVTMRFESGLKVDIHNAEEIITAYEYLSDGDSLSIRMPLFNSEFKGVVSADGSLYSGSWFNYDRNDYSIPFKAVHGQNFRFCETNSSAPPLRFPGRYEVHFSPDDPDDHYAAIGMMEFMPNSNRITGTFATETGDYRFLEGNLCDGKVNLSCFDGSHAFLFKADYVNGSLENGIFYSGTHWIEPWTGMANADFALRDPDHLTVVVDSSAIWATSVINENGDRQGLNEMGLEDKVVILQVLGSWCPNCVDESRLYKNLFEKYAQQGLTIIPISFENTDSAEDAYTILAEFRSDLDLPYPLYFGGERSKKAASEALPSLSHIMSFPTSVFIDRSGKVRKVHTGFYGPGTGVFYDNMVHDTELLIEQMLSEG